jgi:hypothetical protein
MHVAVKLDTAVGDPSPVTFRWDVDTDILTAEIAGVKPGTGMTGSVEIEGSDGSWLILDVRGGEIGGVEVAVWPDVRVAPSLAPPAGVTDAHVTIPSRSSQPGVASLEVDTQLFAEADSAERTIHFRLGAPRTTTTVRAARDLLLEVDESRHLVGVWMLNVPPFPSEP